MQTTELGIEGAFLFTPSLRADDRGVFLETYREDALLEATGRTLDVAQVNTSVSAAGTVRGIHFAEIPPGQAKYVTCVHGAILDVVVDIRTGSPTFGRWEATRLDSRRREAVFLAEGLGHAFMALEDGTVVTYLCSTPYAPTREHGLHPLDSELAVDWPEVGAGPLLSPKDAAAPSLAAAREEGVLPRYDEWQGHQASLRRR